MKYPIDIEACIRAVELTDKDEPLTEEQRGGVALALRRINDAYEAGRSGDAPDLDFEPLDDAGAVEKASRAAAAWHGPQKHQLVHFMVSFNLWENEAYRQGEKDAGGKK